MGWGGWAAGGIDAQPVPGGHLDMVLEPHVRVLAKRLRACLAAADK
jgi:thioesterase domain-containing protein